MTLLTNLVSYWKLDDASGSSAADATATADTGTWLGTLGSQWGTGKINGAGIFNGTDNAISVSGSGFPVGSGARSIAAWIYPNNLTSRGMIVCYGPDSTNFEDFDMEINGWRSELNGHLLVNISNSGAMTQTACLTANAWNHVACTYIAGDTLQNGLALYVNGVAQTVVDIGTALSEGYSWAETPNTVLANPFIGKRIDGSGLFYGRIDEVGIWSRTLASTEISSLYNSGSGNAYPFGTIWSLAGTIAATDAILPATLTQVSIHDITFSLGTPIAGWVAGNPQSGWTAGAL